VWSVESRLMLTAWPPRLRGTKSVAMDFRPLLDNEIVFAEGLWLDILVDDLVVCENGRAGQVSGCSLIPFTSFCQRRIRLWLVL
jgi:hypothetical protein